LANRVDQAVADIARTIANLDLVDARRLTITLLPSVASLWLVPRLPRFHALHPDVELQLVADPRPIDLRAARIDLAIRFGRGTYPGYAVTKLMPDRVFPVCSPRFIAQRGQVTTIEALLDLPLLHDSSTEGDGSGTDWQSWLNQFAPRPLHQSARRVVLHPDLKTPVYIDLCAHAPGCASTFEAFPIRMSDEAEQTRARARTRGMRAIGRKPRAMYADIIAEGVPERFIAILRRLDEPSVEGSAFARWIAEADGGRCPHSP
jgi:DNA-binding transcriptional LysR family regulator